VTLRGVLHKRSIRGGMTIKNKADGRIERMVSSKRSVKSNVTRPGNWMNGPKLLSNTGVLELFIRDASSGYTIWVSISSKYVGVS
jgi:hypothetical protein